MLLPRSIGRLAPTRLVVSATSTKAASSAASAKGTRILSRFHLSTGASAKLASDVGITIEDSCLMQLKKILVKPQDEFLRINVETGGCSGFSYEFYVENSRNLDPNEDLIYERESYKVVINKEILPYMKGSAIEYSESLIKNSFRIKNPIAETKCSCGASFSIDPNKIK